MTTPKEIWDCKDPVRIDDPLHGAEIFSDPKMLFYYLQNENLDATKIVLILCEPQRFPEYYPEEFLEQEGVVSGDFFEVNDNIAQAFYELNEKLKDEIIGWVDTEYRFVLPPNFLEKYK